MKLAVRTHKFRPASLAKLTLAQGILDEYSAMGYRMTIRQLYYQMVARGHIPNSFREYKKIVELLKNGREGGYIDWHMIEDRARRTYLATHWDDPAEIARNLHHWFQMDHWENQKNHVEVMLEKDALAGVLSSVCTELDVRLSPNRGYASASIMFNHARRLYSLQKWHGKKIHVLYLGDHDPSGLDMDNDIQERLVAYSRSGLDFTFQRLALTMPQIEQYDPPPDPAKARDSRSPAYIAQYGIDVWELDALEPQVLSELVETAVLELRDEEKHEEILAKEEQMRDYLKEGMEEWADNMESEAGTLPWDEEDE